MTRDLSKLASTSCGGLNLEEELKKYLLPSPPRTPPKAEGRKRKIALSGPEAQKRLKEGERENHSQPLNSRLQSGQKLHTLNYTPVQHMGDSFNQAPPYCWFLYLNIESVYFFEAVCVNI